MRPCGDGEARLVLTPRSSIPLAGTAAPAGLALLPDGSLVTAERGSAGVSVRSADGGRTRWIPAPEPLPVLALANGELLGAGLTSVYRIRPDSGNVERLMEVPLHAGQIVSLATDGRTLWVGTGGLAAGTGEVYAASRRGPARWRRMATEAPVRLEPAGSGRAAAALTHAPHRVMLLDSQLAAGASSGPRTNGRGNDDARFTQALVTLDCGRLLHVVADLRSDRRELRVLQIAPAPRLVRSRAIRQPVGFVHARDGRSLVAVREKEGRREVILFDWSWQSQ